MFHLPGAQRASALAVMLAGSTALVAGVAGCGRARDTEARRGPAHDREVGIRSRTQTMVDVHRGNVDAGGGGEREQREGVGTARTRDDDGLAGAREIFQHRHAVEPRSQ